MYTLDTTLPASGYRTRGDNSQLIIIGIKEHTWLAPLERTWRFHMAINPAAGTYHAELRMTDWASRERSKPIPVEIPSRTIGNLVKAAQDPEFMGLNENDIFPGVAIMDGTDVDLRIKSPAGSLSLCTNVLMLAEEDGIIRTATRRWQTGLHVVRRKIGEVVDVPGFCSL